MFRALGSGYGCGRFLDLLKWMDPSFMCALIFIVPKNVLWLLIRRTTSSIVQALFTQEYKIGTAFQLLVVNQHLLRWHGRFRLNINRQMHLGAIKSILRKLLANLAWTSNISLIRMLHGTSNISLITVVTEARSNRLLLLCTCS